MEMHVFMAVLAAAVFHASWNAMLKLDLEPLKAVTVLSVACGVVAAPFAYLTGLPEPAAWPYIAASLAIHLVYYGALGAAYRFGDLGQVYPIARGSAPLMTAVGASLIVGETLAPRAMSGIAVLGVGILLLSIAGRTGLRFDPRAVGFALLTALSISAYTLVDGIGGRIGPSAFAYIAWLMLLDGIMMLAFGFWKWPRTFRGDMQQNPILFLVGGLLSTASYAIAIWAMSVAPIALVAALRETSVLFAAAIGVVFLREPVVGMRILAALLVVAGMVLIRLG
jgi:drug/metabolite transporter (DMT)-like permease